MKQIFVIGLFVCFSYLNSIAAVKDENLKRAKLYSTVFKEYRKIEILMP